MTKEDFVIVCGDFGIREESDEHAIGWTGWNINRLPPCLWTGIKKILICLTHIPYRGGMGNVHAVRPSVLI